MYSEKKINAIRKWVKAATDARTNAIAMEHVVKTAVEFGTNSKLNTAFNSVGTLPIIDCGKACKECYKGCYATRGFFLMPNKINKMARNSARLAVDRDKFFSEVKAACLLSVCFRWQESGEVTDYDYLCRIMAVCQDTPQTEHILFTKRADLIEEYLNNGGTIPANLHLLLSGWCHAPKAVGNLPFAMPDFSQAPNEYRKEFILPIGRNRIDCTGDCTKCYLTRSGCFGATGADCVVFMAH